MSNYIFAPSPSFGISEHDFVTYVDAFNEEEIAQLITTLDGLEKMESSVGGIVGTAPEEIRKSKIAWVQLNQSTSWIYDRMAWVARLLNGQFYKFDLHGFSEDMQYTVYEGIEKNHYTWHKDSGGSLRGSAPPRKLSLVLQLSDPEEYEGGSLELNTGTDNPVVVTKQKGLIAAFPSYTVHRVTPVTQGVRKSLVVWVCGPSFR